VSLYLRYLAAVFVLTAAIAFDAAVLLLGALAYPYLAGRLLGLLGLCYLTYLLGRSRAIKRPEGGEAGTQRAAEHRVLRLTTITRCALVCAALALLMAPWWGWPAAVGASVLSGAVQLGAGVVLVRAAQEITEEKLSRGLVAQARGEG
jgi:hypothetical protein